MIEKIIETITVKETAQKTTDNLPYFFQGESNQQTIREDNFEELLSKGEKNGISENVSEGNNTEEEGNKVKTINQDLEGKKHPVTGVLYERDTLPDDREGVFPVFDPLVEVQLPKEQHLETDREQFKSCNESLKEQIANNPDLKATFTKEQLEQIENGRTPSGYTWHHHQQDGKMQLVDTADHDKSAHTGGKALWGGGKDNR